jgi:hypothetical protein
MPPVAYPTILMQSEWNKKKGLFTKVVAEPTKLGEALKKAEKAYKDVHWDILFKKPGDDVELKAINDQISKAGSEVKPQTNALKTALNDVKTQATVVKGMWSTNKMIPKDAKTHLDNLIFAIGPFMAHLDADIKAAMLGLLAAQQKRAYLNEKEAEEEEVEVAKGKPQPKDAKGNLIAPKLKIKPGAQKAAVESERQEEEGEEG